MQNSESIRLPKDTADQFRIPVPRAFIPKDATPTPEALDPAVYGENQQKLDSIKTTVSEFEAEYPFALAHYLYNAPEDEAYLAYILSSGYQPSWLSLAKPHTVYFDIETLFMPNEEEVSRQTYTNSSIPRQKQGLGIGVAIDEDGGVATWNTENAHDFIRHLLTFDQIVSFNGVSFDNVVLSGYLEPEEAQELFNKSFDLMHYAQMRYGLRRSLNFLAKSELGFSVPFIPYAENNSKRIPEALRSGQPSTRALIWHKCFMDAYRTMQLYNRVIGTDEHRNKQRVFSWFLDHTLAKANSIMNQTKRNEAEIYESQVKEFAETVDALAIEVSVHTLPGPAMVFERNKLRLMETFQRFKPELQAAISLGLFDASDMLKDLQLPPLVHRVYGKEILETYAAMINKLEPLSSLLLKSRINEFFPGFMAATDFLESENLVAEYIPIEKKMVFPPDADKSTNASIFKITDTTTGEVVVITKNVHSQLRKRKDIADIINNTTNMMTVSSNTQHDPTPIDVLAEKGFIHRKSWEKPEVFLDFMRGHLSRDIHFQHVNVEHLMYDELLPVIGQQVVECEAIIANYRDLADTPEYQHVRNYYTEYERLFRYLHFTVEQMLESENLEETLPFVAYLQNHYGSFLHAEGLLPEGKNLETYHPVDVITLETDWRNEKHLVFDPLGEKSKRKKIGKRKIF